MLPNIVRIDGNTQNSANLLNFLQSDSETIRKSTPVIRMNRTNLCSGCKRYKLEIFSVDCKNFH